MLHKRSGVTIPVLHPLHLYRSPFMLTVMCICIVNRRCVQAPAGLDLQAWHQCPICLMAAYPWALLWVLCLRVAPITSQWEDQATCPSPSLETCPSPSFERSSDKFSPAYSKVM